MIFVNLCLFKNVEINEIVHSAAVQDSKKWPRLEISLKKKQKIFPKNSVFLLHIENYALIKTIFQLFILFL